jgi:hypothetical protein
MGVLLRLTNVIPLGFDYAKLIHAHSHTAMLGWVYLMLFCFFVHYFVPTEKHRKYNILFWLTQFTVVGMMVSFPIQGYGLYSIAFSTLHILCSYVFCFRIFQDNVIEYLPAKRLMVTSLAFMLASTLGAWSLGVVMHFTSKDSPLYRTAIQFFLHFQFNGWFVFAVLAIFFFVARQCQISINEKLFRTFYWSLLFSAIVTFALPISWNFSSQMLFYVNIVGVASQLVSLFCLNKLIGFQWNKILATHSRANFILALSLVSFAIKVIVQATSVFPSFADASHSVRNFTIGFIHLGMLGIVTGFLLFFLLSSGFAREKCKLWKTGIGTFYAGFLLTELVLFTGGLIQFLKHPPIIYYAEMLFGTSLLLPVGLIIIIAGFVRRKM